MQWPRSIRSGAALVWVPLVIALPGSATGEAPPLAGRRPAAVVDGEPLAINPYNAYPAMGDIDGDGRDDLLIGDPKGNLSIYRGIGGTSPPRFAPAEPFGDYCDDPRIPVG